MSVVVSHLFVYPLKSARGVCVPHAQVTPRGLAGDRRWMVVDSSGVFVTGRTHPHMLLLRTQQTESGLQLQAPDGRQRLIRRPQPDGPTAVVQVWNDQVVGHMAAPEDSAWLSSVLGLTCRLVYMADQTLRQVDEAHAPKGDVVSFADGFPLLLTTDGSLRDLNERLDAPVEMSHFRPNLVLSGVSAFAEDHWTEVRIGEAVFGVAKPCARCVLTTVNPTTAVRHASGEPLRTLATYRKGPGGILFGQNLTVRRGGRIAVGDPVTVITAR